ncbi:MAG: hypothetical protein O2930_05515 [Acidobacteria bacterium]|nr:hypothetical protein [Acidobacteriota bacterium]
MAIRATRAAVEQQCATLCVIRQGAIVVVMLQVLIEGTVEEGIRGRLEGGDRIGGVLKTEIPGPRSSGRTCAARNTLRSVLSMSFVLLAEALPLFFELLELLAATSSCRLPTVNNSPAHTAINSFPGCLMATAPP